MDRFRTKINPPDFSIAINHHHSILGMGSCFSVEMLLRLAQLKFKTTSNPFGILYNPLSIAIGLQQLLDHRQFEESTIFEYDGLWHSFQHHGAFSGLQQDEVLTKINTHLQIGQQALAASDRLLITLGTAFVFKHLASDQVVANCHKVPAHQFKRTLLDVATIVSALTKVVDQIQQRRPNIQILLSVSPIRHIRDGLIANKRSKAILVESCHQLTELFPYVHYFPSYEIMMDDLRDYRFYAEDMIHPSKLAIDYIWKLFVQAFFSEETQLLNTQLQKINNGLAHRPIHPKSDQHLAFLKKMQSQINSLQSSKPFLNLEVEREAINDKLALF